jgi:hypothetical protein
VVDSYFVESASYGIGGAEPPLTELRPPVCAIAFSRASALLPAWTSVSWKVLDTHPVRTPRTTRWAHGTTAPSTEGSPPPTRRVSRSRLHVRRRQLHGQHRPKRLSEYDWREMVNRLSSGIAEVSGNIAWSPIEILRRKASTSASAPTSMAAFDLDRYPTRILHFPCNALFHAGQAAFYATWANGTLSPGGSDTPPSDRPNNFPVPDFGACLRSDNVTGVFPLVINGDRYPMTGCARR